MKTKLSPLFLIAAGCLTLGASAQVATPTPLAPSAPAADTQAAPPASQIVYLPRLPSAAELTNAGTAQGLSIDRIVQTTSQMTVVYRTANGQTNTVAYVLLPANGGSTAPDTPVVAAPTTSAPAVAYTPAPTTKVVYYTEPAPAYYYDPFYAPGYYGPWYAPVALSVGFGLGYYGHYHGGYHGGGYYGGHGRH